MSAKNKIPCIEIESMTIINNTTTLIRFKIKASYSVIAIGLDSNYRFYYLDGKTPYNRKEVEKYISMDLDNR